MFGIKKDSLGLMLANATWHITTLEAFVATSGNQPDEEHMIFGKNITLYAAHANIHGPIAVSFPNSNPIGICFFPPHGQNLRLYVLQFLHVRLIRVYYLLFILLLDHGF